MTHGLDDSAVALADAMDIDISEVPSGRYTENDAWHDAKISGAHALAKQLRIMMQDIASEFGGDPVNCAATTVFAVAGVVSDVYAIAAVAGLCDVSEVPPHPMRTIPQMPAMNRAERRQMARELQRRTPFVLPPQQPLRPRGPVSIVPKRED
jgi:hypothetical protein